MMTQEFGRLALLRRVRAICLPTQVGRPCTKLFKKNNVLVVEESRQEGVCGVQTKNSRHEPARARSATRARTAVVEVRRAMVGLWRRRVNRIKDGKGTIKCF
jgi:hypothetical protein